jgi:hypothetical protein
MTRFSVIVEDVKWMKARKIMTHYVQLSSYPNYVCRTEERLYEFAGNELRLSVRSIKVGDQLVSSYLRWRKR